LTLAGFQDAISITGLPGPFFQLPQDANGYSLATRFRPYIHALHFHGTGIVGFDRSAAHCNFTIIGYDHLPDLVDLIELREERMFLAVALP